MRLLAMIASGDLTGWYSRWKKEDRILTIVDLDVASLNQFRSQSQIPDSSCLDELDHFRIDSTDRGTLGGLPHDVILLGIPFKTLDARSEVTSPEHRT